MTKIINYFSVILSIIEYSLLLFFYKLDSNYLKEIIYVYLLAIPCVMVFISSFLVDDQKTKKKNLYLYLIAYFTALIGFVFSNARTESSAITSGIQSYAFNFIPFRSTIELLNNPLGLKFGLYNILGNFLMLTPLSILLPLICNKFKKTKTFLAFLYLLNCVSLFLMLEVLILMIFF